MDQLSCSKIGHEKLPILGICMADSCKSDQRISCRICLQVSHANCKNQFYGKGQFIKSLKELKIQIEKQDKSDIISLLNEVKEKVQHYMRILQQFCEFIIQESIRINPSDIDLILENQNTLSTQDWNEGYKLLKERVVVPLGMKVLKEQLHQIQESSAQIASIQSESKPDQQNPQIKLCTVQTPIIIKTVTPIMSIALSPNGQQLATAGSGDYSIRIWDIITGNQIGNPLLGHTSLIRSIKYSKCGDSIISGSFDETIRQWNVLNQKQIGYPMMHDNVVMGVDYSSDERYIISCSLDSTIRFWNSKTAQEYVPQRIIHGNWIYCQALSPIQNELAIGDKCGTISIYNYSKQYVRQLFHTDCTYLNTISYSSNGQFILLVKQDNSIGICDLSVGKLIRIYIGHTSHIYSVNFSPDQKQLISGGADNTVRIWNRMTGQQIGQSLIHHELQVYSTQFSFCGKYIITGGFDGQIRIMLVPIEQ